MSRVFVGIDWGTESHHVCVMRHDGKVEARFEVSHDLPGIRKMFERIEACVSLSRAVFVLERPDGLLVDALHQRGVEVWHINPRQMDRFRDRHSMSGAKDDPRDAFVLADSARTDPHLFRVVQVRDEVVQQLRAAARLHSDLGVECLRHKSAAEDAFAAYYPQLLQVVDDLRSDWGRALVKVAPNPTAARKLKAHVVERICKKHQVRKWTAEEILEMLRGDALTAHPGAAAAAERRALAHVAVLATAVAQWREAEREYERLLELLPHGKAANGGSPTTPSWAEIATAVRSMPGAGSKITATLLGEAPEALQAASYQELRTLAGAAPVTVTTGKRSKTNPPVRMRRACDAHLRDMMQAWGQSAARADAHWREYRAGLLARRHTPARANRQVADRLLAILCALIRDRSTYDPKRVGRGRPSAGSAASQP